MTTTSRRAALPSPNKSPRAALRADPWGLGPASPAVRERSFSVTADAIQRRVDSQIAMREPVLTTALIRS